MDLSQATQIVQKLLEPSLQVVATSALTGGMVNTVELWQTDAEPRTLVAKISAGPEPMSFRHEYNALQYHRENRTLAVPRALARAEPGEVFEGSCLLLEKVQGRNMAQMKVSPEGLGHLQRDLAGHIADLHEHRRENYGLAWGKRTFDRWIDHFGPRITANFEKMADKFTQANRRSVEDLLSNLEDWLGEFSRPTLVHGDLWATNIMVDDGDPDRPVVRALLDGGANFHEVESELAYLLVFNTADAAFFDAYTRRHPLRPGFKRRCLVYWLNTIMLHVWRFGDAYLPRCQRLAQEIARKA
jgi:fructosamine-3-kinase